MSNFWYHSRDSSVRRENQPLLFVNITVLPIVLFILAAGSLSSL